MCTDVVQVPSGRRDAHRGDRVVERSRADECAAHESAHRRIRRLQCIEQHVGCRVREASGDRVGLQSAVETIAPEQQLRALECSGRAPIHMIAVRSIRRKRRRSARGRQRVVDAPRQSALERVVAEPEPQPVEQFVAGAEPVGHDAPGGVFRQAFVEKRPGPLVAREQTVEVLVCELVDRHPLDGVHARREEPQALRGDQRRVFHAADTAGAARWNDHGELRVRIASVACSECRNRALERCQRSCHDTGFAGRSEHADRDAIDRAPRLLERSPRGPREIVRVLGDEMVSIAIATLP